MSVCECEVTDLLLFVFPGCFILLTCYLGLPVFGLLGALLQSLRADAHLDHNLKQVLPVANLETGQEEISSKGKLQCSV